MENKGFFPCFKNRLPTCKFSKTDESSPTSQTVFPSIHFRTVTYDH